MGTSLIDQISNTAVSLGVDPDLAVAIAGKESDYNPLAVKAEPKWKYFYMVDVYAARMLITPETEKALQSMSWGVMQVMGSVARELGLNESLLALATDPAQGILYGCKKLAQLAKQYDKEAQVIAAYNAGSPRKGPDGLYCNQPYVDDVQARLARLRSIG